MKYKLGKKRPRSWGLEIPVTFTDDVGQDHNLLMIFKSNKPLEKEVNNMVKLWEQRVINVMQAEKKEREKPPEILREEVEGVLKEKRI